MVYHTSFYEILTLEHELDLQIFVLKLCAFRFKTLQR